MTFRFLLSLFLFYSVAFAGSREISGFSKPLGKYLLVSKSVFIQTGDTLVVSAGREVLFSTYAGITVQPGACLLAQGTKEKPVYFTSLQDTTTGSAAAFDWNGIEVKKGAAAQFKYCFVAFSTSGITAEDSIGVLLENCIFSVNGQWSFSVSGVILPVKDLQPFSWPSKKSIPLSLTPVLKDTVSPVSKSLHSPSHPGLKKRDLMLSGVGALCIIAGATSLYFSSKYRSDYNRFVPGNSEYDNATPQSRQNQFDKLRSKTNSYSAVGFSFLGAALIDGFFLAVTMRF